MTSGARKGEQPGSSRDRTPSDPARRSDGMVRSALNDRSGTPALLPRLQWAQELPTADGSPYLRRWVLDLGVGAIRLHHWICSDDSRAPHDHPYWMAILVLRGGYDDVGFPVDGDITTDELRWLSARFRRAEHRHWVRVHPGGCWTLLLTGRQSRVWGFWTERYDGARRFVRSSRYFRRHGAHPCDR